MLYTYNAYSRRSVGFHVGRFPGNEEWLQWNPLPSFDSGR